MDSSSKPGFDETGHGLLSRHNVGRLEVLASAAGYGFIGIFGKRAFAAGLGPGEFLTMRFAIASALLWLYVLAFRRDILKLGRRQVLSCVALGVCGYALFSSLYFRALEGLSASLTALILYTYPVIVTIGARVLFKEHVSWRRAAALPVVAVGLVMLLWGDLAVTDWRAVGFGLGSAVLYSAYILASSRLLRGIDMMAAGLAIMTSAALALSVAALPTAEQVAALDAGGWGSVVGIAVLSTIGPLILFLKGLEKMTNAEASILSLVEPLTAVVAAGLLLGERLAPVQLAGGAVILAALLFSSTNGTKRRESNS
jgi:drug/metabolite transporter (DMT)-like permease